MTEAEWLGCTNPREMLHALHGQASERKLRLFACACCRLVWHRLPGLCHRLVEAAEQFADKEINQSDLATLFKKFQPYHVALPDVTGGNQAAEAVGRLGLHWQLCRCGIAGCFSQYAWVRESVCIALFTISGASLIEAEWLPFWFDVRDKSNEADRKQPVRVVSNTVEIQIETRPPK